MVDLVLQIEGEGAVAVVGQAEDFALAVVLDSVIVGVREADDMSRIDHRPFDGVALRLHVGAAGRLDVAGNLAVEGQVNRLVRAVRNHGGEGHARERGFVGIRVGVVDTGGKVAVAGGLRQIVLIDVDRNGSRQIARRHVVLHVDRECARRRGDAVAVSIGAEDDRGEVDLADRCRAVRRRTQLVVLVVETVVDVVELIL